MTRSWLILFAALVLAPAASAQLVKAPWPASLSAEAREGLAANDARPPEPATIEGRRDRAEAIQREIGAPRLARYGVTMKDDVIAGVPVRLFTPAKGAAKGRVLLNLHGGGFLVDAGSISENAAVAALTGYPVVAVRYRLAPENPFPAAVDDAVAVYRALLSDHEPKRIGLYGTSAGAILSAELVARLRADKLPQPAALGFFSGTADLSRQADSVTLFADPSAATMLVQLYAGARAADDPLLSPQRGDLAGWPATLCLTSGRDFLLSATADFCRALDAAGVPAQLMLFDGLPHAFWSYIDAPETDAAFAAMARFFAARLGDGK
ncbi:alpha/beta hydrolase [Sphingopyxis lindanitolerans]|uniref:Alpha/beta hydrolase n=1 Tax=Sphingopyxis lindanitolerans TaxID=2054227 RepID=A0A2S8B3X7_9SPHN|nr:alpha/beta hydrolase fold domain-containing protein [Sphingopyxis lindanitolerans]PQM27104.1 alpha/beta hydrolase [Sphingopyxis lindanitolerans]